MTLNLTEIGWVDENGTLLGTWSNQGEVVNDDTAITVDQGLIVNTLNGDDVINLDNGSEGILIDDDAVLDTGNGNDTILGSGFIGINLEFNAVLDTGNGNDTITGDGFDGFFLTVSSQISTGNGSDNILGTGFAVGIGSRGTINTGRDNDTITGIANAPGGDFFGSVGISNSFGTIDTGGGDDMIFASGQDFAISNNSGTINTGRGNDIIDALSGGFTDDGLGQINLGRGDDLIRGFGDHQGNIDGGDGSDRAELGFDYDATLITFGSVDPTSIDITFNSETASFTNIELFDFNGQEFSLEQLQAEV